MKIKEKAELVKAYLYEDYPIVRSPLYHRNVFEFLIAVMLSPQTNDEITNKVLPGLFEKFSTPEALGKAEFSDVKNLIRSVNYNNTKTKRIIEASRILAYEYDSKVPSDINELTKLPGVGRKVANVIINDWYATPEEENPPHYIASNKDDFNEVPRGSVSPSGFVVDTHVNRISNALGFTNSKNPDRIEKDLMEIYDSKYWMGVSLRMIFHGREVFPAKNPDLSRYPKWEEIYKL